jgi:hypothetical protein
MMLSCRRASRLQSDGLERALTLMERVELRGHLLACAACRRHRRQVLGLEKLVRGMGLENGEERLSREARERISVGLRIRLGRGS